MAHSDNIQAPCEKEATCEPGKPHPGAGRHSPGSVLSAEGITDAVVLLNVLRAVNERGRHMLMTAAKKPLEKTWTPDGGFGGCENPGVRRGRSWHEINMREPHLAVNKPSGISWHKRKLECCIGNPCNQQLRQFE